LLIIKGFAVTVLPTAARLNRSLNVMRFANDQSFPFAQMSKRKQNLFAGFNLQEVAGVRQACQPRGHQDHPSISP
jgi:hypothetical protein